MTEEEIKAAEKEAAKKTKYSYSKLDTYVQCGMKFKLKYMDGHNMFSQSVATKFGTLVHATEEEIAKRIQGKQSIDYKQLRNEFIKQMWMIRGEFPADWYELDKSGRTYQQKSYEYLEKGIYNLEKFMREHPTYEICGIEQKFNFEFAGKKFNGFIDRAFHDTATDEYIIQDIKTWAVPTDDDHLKTPLQFVTYVMAAQALWNADPAKIRCQYYLPVVLDGNGVFGLTQDAGTKGFVKRGKEKIISLCVDIDDDYFPPNPTPLCHWCNFCPTNKNAPAEERHLCPYFSHWTRENKDFSVNQEYDANKSLLLEHKEKHKLHLEAKMKELAEAGISIV